MSHVDLVHLLTLISAALTAGVVTWIVIALFGAVVRLVMILVVPVLAFFFVWPLARTFGDRGCSYECDSATVLGVLILTGVLAGIAIAATAMWARDRYRVRG